MILLRDRGETLIDLAAGLANRAEGRPISTETRFATASGTKGFTALAVVSLIEEGLLTFDIRLYDVVGGDLPNVDKAVTIEQLLGHTSGAGDYLDEEAQDSIDDYVLDLPVHSLLGPDDYLPPLARPEQMEPPGSRFRYNDSGYLLLALAIERVAGRSYQDMMRFWDALLEGRIVAPPPVELMTTENERARLDLDQGHCSYGLVLDRRQPRHGGPGGRGRRRLVPVGSRSGVGDSVLPDGEQFQRRVAAGHHRGPLSPGLIRRGDEPALVDRVAACWRCGRGLSRRLRTGSPGLYRDLRTTSGHVDDMMTALDQTDWALRESIYAGLAATGAAPGCDALAQVAGGHRELEHRLRTLHDHDLVVLDRDGSIRMALPFSAIPTDHVVRSGERRWFANCAWDTLAIPAALEIDADIEAPWLDDDTPVELRIVDGELVGHLEAYVHFVVPARSWWDDIVDT